MRAIFLLTAVLLVTGTQANFLDGLKSAFGGIGSVLKATGQSLLGQLDSVATDLLHAVTSTGLKLVSQGTQALALNTANQFANAKDGASKRDLGAMLGKLDHFKNDVVDMLKLGEHQLKGVMGNVIQAFDGVLSKVADFEISPESVISAVDNIVGAHHSLMNRFLKDVVSSVESIVGKHFNLIKRNSFTDFFSNLGSTLSNAFSPMIEGVKNLVTSTGSAIKTTATSLLSAAKDSVSQLGQKLTPHLEALKNHAQTLLQHSTNALSALKDATSDIFQQTLHNMQPSLSGVVDTVKDAANTAVNHLADTLTGGR